MRPFVPLRGSNDLNRIQDAIKQALDSLSRDLEAVAAAAGVSTSDATTGAEIADAVTTYTGSAIMGPNVCFAVYVGSGAHTLTLPSAAAQGANVGQLLRILHAGTGTLTVQRAALDTINGSFTSFALTPGQSADLASDGTTRWGWMPQGLTMRHAVEFFDDFLNIGDGLQNGMVAVVTGGTVAVQAGDVSHPGVIRLDTGGAATNRAAIASHTRAIMLGSGRVRFTAWLKVANLSSAGERYTLRVGLQDSVTGDSTNGVYFRYVDNVNGGLWQIVGRNAAVETAGNAGVGPVAGTWYRMEIDVAANGATAACYINGASVGSVGGIGTGAGKETGLVPASIIKSIGITARNVDVDAYHAIVEFSTAR